jgi:hypothetical protein
LTNNGTRQFLDISLCESKDQLLGPSNYVCATHTQQPIELAAAGRESDTHALRHSVGPQDEALLFLRSPSPQQQAAILKYQPEFGAWRACAFSIKARSPSVWNATKALREDVIQARSVSMLFVAFWSTPASLSLHDTLL